MIPGDELLVHELMAGRRREAAQERIASSLRPRRRHRMRRSRTGFMSSTLMLARHAARRARLRIGGGPT